MTRQKPELSQGFAIGSGPSLMGVKNDLLRVALLASYPQSTLCQMYFQLAFDHEHHGRLV